MRPPLESSAGSKWSLRVLETELLRGPDDGPLISIAESPQQSPTMAPTADQEPPLPRSGSLLHKRWGTAQEPPLARSGSLPQLKRWAAAAAEEDAAQAEEMETGGDEDVPARQFLDPQERHHLEEMKAQEMQRMDEMEDEELRRVEEMEARVEEQLQAALAELQASMQCDDFSTLDDATKGLVRQLGPRVKQHEAQRQERLSALPRTRKPRIKLQSVR